MVLLKSYANLYTLTKIYISSVMYINNSEDDQETRITYKVKSNISHKQTDRRINKDAKKLLKNSKVQFIASRVQSNFPRRASRFGDRLGK